MPLSKESREKLIAAGRIDLIEIMDINDSGYAGVLPNGNIVDRRMHPEAIPVQKNTMLGIPESKKLPTCFKCHEEITLIHDGICINEGTEHEMFQCDDCHLIEHGVRIWGGSLHFHKIFNK